MLRLYGWLAVAAVLATPLTASAHGFGRPVVAAYPDVACYTPAVSFYAPQPVVAYAAPVVAYSPPVVAYAPPVTAYYAPAAPVTVSTYRYGLFGRRSLTTVDVGAAPAVVVPRRAFYAPAVFYP